MNVEPWREKAKKLKTEIYALYFAYRDPRVPWYAKAFIIAIVGYALSPIDLIPDFIPVLGYVDDIIIIPVAISLALKMIPDVVLEECREKAQSTPVGNHWAAAVAIIVIWLAALYGAIHLVWALI